MNLMSIYKDIPLSKITMNVLTERTNVNNPNTCKTYDSVLKKAIVKPISTINNANCSIKFLIVFFIFNCLKVK